uniref:Cytoskeleton-associated protein 2 C-terminal domain-containing protein n=1 Tax=Scophthalmus maximus TaxID=52904 RepID=A0A8D2ZIC5_SCOMX
MDNVGNKENAQPALGSKSLIKRDKTSVAPFHLKSNEKEETLAKNGPLKAKAKQADTRSVSGVALKTAKTAQKDGKGAVASDVSQRRTHSRAFLAEQAVKHKKIAADAPKPAAAVQSSLSAPGLYKGKIVQSKIGSIWRSNVSLDRADPKSSATSMKSQGVGNVTKTRSKPVAGLPGCGTRKPAPTTSKSVFSRPAQVSKPAVTSRPPAGFYSARPPARTIPATLTSTSSRNPPVAATKGSGALNSKPKIPTTEQKVNKPPVSSSLSQYRLTMETAEERRAKLAGWLASKGKTFKRPAMTTSHAEPQPTAQCNPEIEPSLETHGPDSTAADCADTQGAELTKFNQTPEIGNTTLELLENSVDTQDSIVVNLCDALDAMEPPSRCSDGKFSCSLLIYSSHWYFWLLHYTDECNGVETEDGKLNDERKKEEVKSEAEDGDENQVQTDDEEVESDDDVMETTPQMEDASVVKYSVRTTPYLQSVKRTIEGEVSTSRKKSNIKDLKFLTPVRRSTRIQRKSSHLPTMLVEHDTCVSSLAELVKLDDDPNAYIYRKNPALLEDLPDQPRQ